MLFCALSSAFVTASVWPSWSVFTCSSRLFTLSLSVVTSWVVEAAPANFLSAAALAAARAISPAHEDALSLL